MEEDDLLFGDRIYHPETTIFGDCCKIFCVWREYEVYRLISETAGRHGPAILTYDTPARYPPVADRILGRLFLVGFGTDRPRSAYRHRMPWRHRDEDGVERVPLSLRVARRGIV